MKKLLLILFLLSASTLFSQFSELAKTPPIGWNSWNAFGLDINSTIVMAVADSMVTKGVADAGYEYVVIDDGWQIDRDENGRILADSTRFPDGLDTRTQYRIMSDTIKATTSNGVFNASCNVKIFPSSIQAPWMFDKFKGETYLVGLEVVSHSTHMLNHLKIDRVMANPAD